jgi:hypothetical protein
MIEHSIFAYISFLVYIKQKASENCNGLEKYVKERLEDNVIDFFPNSTATLAVKGINSEENTSVIL